MKKQRDFLSQLVSIEMYKSYQENVDFGKNEKSLFYLFIYSYCYYYYLFIYLGGEGQNRV